MKKIAVEKAQARLERAREAYSRIRASKNFRDFEPAWIDFITALNTIHSVLEHGARACPKSRQWYGGMKQERRTDPLLQYIHQARNADEHGIEPIAQHDPGGIGLARGRDVVLLNKVVVDGRGLVHWDVTTPGGEKLAPEIIPPQPRLKTVHNYGHPFDPPREHLRKRLSDGSPYEVAALALEYHETLVREAAGMVSNVH